MLTYVNIIEKEAFSMKIIKAAACAVLCLSALCACGRKIDNYRIYDDLVPSFTSALSDRTLKSEKITKSEDGRRIVGASYTYKSKKPEEDKESYLYYMLNNKDAAFIADNTVAYDSRDADNAIVISVTSDEKTFTINVTREAR